MTHERADRRWSTPRRLFALVDGSSLAVFRIGFGLTMLWEVYRSFTLDKIYVRYVRLEYRFPYDYFEWVQPWPGDRVTFVERAP